MHAPAGSCVAQPRAQERGAGDQDGRGWSEQRAVVWQQQDGRPGRAGEQGDAHGRPAAGRRVFDSTESNTCCHRVLYTEYSTRSHQHLQLLPAQAPSFVTTPYSGGSPLRKRTRPAVKWTSQMDQSNNDVAAIIETGQNKGGAVPGHTAANSVKHSSWKHGEGVYPASRGW